MKDFGHDLFGRGHYAMTGFRNPPKVQDWYNVLNAEVDYWYQPQNGSQLIVMDPLCSGGGGGGGTNDIAPGSVDPATGSWVHPRYRLYGRRGGDTLALMRTPVPATLVRGPVTRLEFPGAHGMIAGQAFFITTPIPGYKPEELQSPFTPRPEGTYQFTTFYSRAQENWTSTGFEICREPYNPPFSYYVFGLVGTTWRDLYYPDPLLPFQRPIALTGGDLPVMVWTSWYGFMGGTGGGEIGDNGGGQSPWGTHLPGPDGGIQSYHLYAGSSDIIWNGGGRGAQGPYGGAGGSQCSGQGNDAADGTGGGGGGAPPGVTPGDGRPPSNPGCWGMGGGGAGLGGKIWFKPKPVSPGSEVMQPIWFRVGKRGFYGIAGTNGYQGGNGSLGRITTQDFKD